MSTEGAKAMNVTERALAGETIVNIGQVTPHDRRSLDALVRAGVLQKWRGYWYPIAGGSQGIGSLKTCWGKEKAA